VVAELDLQGLLAAAVCAEARQGPIQSCQLEQALHHAKFLPQRLAKQVLAGVGGTAKDWSASADLTGSALQNSASPHKHWVCAVSPTAPSPENQFTSH